MWGLVVSAHLTPQANEILEEFLPLSKKINLLKLGDCFKPALYMVIMVTWNGAELTSGPCMTCTSLSITSVDLAVSAIFPKCRSDPSAAFDLFLCVAVAG